MEKKTIAEILDKKLKEGNISLIIDNYDDLFSSFDPRNYSEKALSDDFLQECRKAARNKEEELELRISIAKKERNPREETIIKKRLKEHFTRNYRKLTKAIMKEKKIGAWWIFSGSTSIALTIVIKLLNVGQITNLIIDSILIIPGWFAIWEGLSRIFIEHKELTPEEKFYKKMSKAEISFAGY